VGLEAGVLAWWRAAKLGEGREARPGVKRFAFEPEGPAAAGHQPRRRCAQIDPGRRRPRAYEFTSILIRKSSVHFGEKPGQAGRPLLGRGTGTGWRTGKHG